MNRAWAIVLAAGESRRMGRPKPALPWVDGRPLLAWSCEELRAGGWSPVVVLGPHNAADWVGRLPGVVIVENGRAAEGKTTSLAAGAQALPAEAERILVTAVDQPRRAALYAALREEAIRQPSRLIVPDNAGHRGHPVILPGSFRARLATLDESTEGLRGLLDAHRAETVRMPCDPADIGWDLNTPEDYARALRWFTERV